MSFSDHLLNWYDDNARVLPWRSAPTPYHVWVSEIMLQQTRVETVLPYYERFLMRFPDLETLAQAEEGDILKAWEGLGYYSRARNLHKTARKLVTELGSQIPPTAAELERLPGIGRYTAAAISSIAFGEPVAATDGNIKRIYARILNLDAPYDSPLFEKTINVYAQSVLSQERPGDFTQALMDLGAEICTPLQPRCEACPIGKYCLGFKLGKQNQLPVRVKKAPIPHYEVCVAVLEHNSKILLRQRDAQGLLAGLWEFPGGKLEPNESLEDCLKRELLNKTGLAISVGAKSGVYKHAYTHFKITVHAWYAKPARSPQNLRENLRWVSPEELPAYPMGKVARRISEKIQTKEV